MAPVEVQFDTAITRVSVYGVGAFKCWTNQYGTMTALDAAGQVVGVTRMAMREPGDCGNDSITYGAYGTVATASPRIRRLVIQPPQPWSWDVWIENEFYGTGYVTADYTLVLSSIPGSTEPTITVQVLSARGPNAGGSFTSAAGENQLALEARVTGVPPDTPIRWSLVDDPSDQVSSTPPSPFNGGPTATATIPAQSLSRWNGITHRAPLNRKALRYLVRASVTVGASTVTSADVVVGQAERDALRQEYLDYQMPLPNAAWITSALAPGSPFSFDELNQGEYANLAVIDPQLILNLTSLKNDAGYAFSFSSCFRDPIHHRQHITVSGGGTPVPRSNHQYGVAADIRTFMDRTRFRALRVKAWDLGACVEPPRISTYDHLHVDWRPPADCLGDWRRPR